MTEADYVLLRHTSASRMCQRHSTLNEHSIFDSQPRFEPVQKPQLPHETRKYTRGRSHFTVSIGSGVHIQKHAIH